MMSIGFVGAGTVGTTLAWSLAQAGWPVAAVTSRTRASAERLAARAPGCRVVDGPQDVAGSADLVLITTPAGAIPGVAGAVAWRPGQGVIHCSGADSAEVLEPARRQGAQVGVAHPLLPFASVERAVAGLPGCTFALEGEGELLATLQAMVAALGCRSVVLRPEDKVLYHAAAVLASNYVVTLAKLATDLWQQLGVDRPAALAALLPLLQGTVRNLDEVGLPAALTGPIARGDGGTVDKHLQALTVHAPELVAVYRALGRHTVGIAEDKGTITTSQGSALRSLLEEEAIVVHATGA